MALGSESLPQPTRDDQHRWAMARAKGCILCGSLHNLEIHHLLVGGLRAGHRYTVCLCQWHHRGMRHGISWAAMKALMGPSLADGSKPFHAYWGDDQDLLERQDTIIGWPLVELPQRAQRLRKQSQRKSKGNTATPSKIIKRGNRLYL